MTAGVQCDMCRTFGPAHAPGWFFLSQIPAEDRSTFASLFGAAYEPLTFCTVKCLADWAYVHAAASEAPTGKEP